MSKRQTVTGIIERNEIKFETVGPAHVRGIRIVRLRDDDGNRYYMKTRAGWAFDVKVGETVTLTGRVRSSSRNDDGTMDVVFYRPLRKKGE